MSRPNSVLDAIHGMRHAFERIGMETPDITLQRHDEGMRLLGELSDYRMMPRSYKRPVGAIAVRPEAFSIADFKPDTDAAPVPVPLPRHIDLPHCGKLVWIVDAENPEPKAFMEVQVMGTKVRWPAMRMSLQGGESIWY